jgi:hypothetical protein
MASQVSFSTMLSVAINVIKFIIDSSARNRVRTLISILLSLFYIDRLSLTFIIDCTELRVSTISATGGFLGKYRGTYYL